MSALELSLSTVNRILKTLTELEAFISSLCSQNTCRCTAPGCISEMNLRIRVLRDLTDSLEAQAREQVPPSLPLTQAAPAATQIVDDPDASQPSAPVA